MAKLNCFFALSFFFLIFTACSKDDEGPTIFISLTASKQFSFIEEAITVQLEAGPFTDVAVSSSNPDINISEVNSKTYTISASEAAETTISVTLKNDGGTETKSIDLDFYEHGIKNFKVVEGIEIGVDETDKILELFGAPDGKEDSSSGAREYWYYFSNGFSFLINKETKIADESRLYGIDWQRTINGKELQGAQYLNKISGSLVIANGQVQMDAMINTLGQPDEKHLSATPSSPQKWYVFNEGVRAFFLSDNIDDYTGKTVLYIDIF